MTRDEAVAEIKRQLGFRTTLDSTIVTELQIAQTDLEGEAQKPWFLISTTSTLVTVAGTQTVSLPSDFLEEIDDSVLQYVPDTISEQNPTVDLVKDELNVLLKNYRDASTGTTETGPPEAYALLGNYFYIFPKPDDAYTLYWLYYAKDTILSTNVENNWLKYYPKLLMGLAGKQISGGPLRDPGAWKVFDDWEQRGRAQLIQRINTRALAGRSLQVGGPH